MNRRQHIALVTGLALTIGLPCAAQDVPLLDLTQPAAAPIPEQAGEQRMAGLHYRIGPLAKRDAWPITLRVIGVDKGEYRRGERIVVEIELQATSQVTIPWSTNGSAVDPDADYSAPAYRSMLVAVWDGRDAALDIGGSAFGSQHVTASLRTLEPGQKVRIRVAGRWAALSGRPAEDMPSETAIRAVLRPVDKGGLTRSLVKSENTVQVRTAR